MSIFKKRKLKTLLEQEMRLAYFLVLPTFFLIFSIVLIPLLANFWISLKPINLEDLRAPQLILKHKIRGNLEVSGDKGIFDIENNLWSREVKWPLEPKPTPQEAHILFLNQVETEFESKTGKLVISISNIRPNTAKEIAQN